jgi:hypothetical protein
MFRLKSEDSTVSSFEVEGDNLIAAPLELNTIQARLHTQGLAATTAIFIVEDIEKNILYFQDSYELHGWVKRDGDEEPYDLNKFPELIEDWRKQIENLIVDAKEVDGGIEVTICNGVSPAKTFIIRNGRDGQQGEPGRKGEDGKSLKFSDLTDAQKAELKGPKGDTGEGITDEFKALPNKVTENAQAIEANRVAINTEENRAKDAEKKLLSRIEESKANAAAAMTAASKAQDTADKTVTEIATLVGDDAGDKRKSARQIAAEEVAKVIAGADTNYDTLKEIADYIKNDATDAAQLKNKVTNLEATKADKSDVVALDERVTELEENGGGGGGGSSVEVVAPSPDGAGKPADAKAVYDELEKKADAEWVRERYVEQESGKGLSEYNFGVDEKLKLQNIEEGAQKNPDLSSYVKKEDVHDLVKDKQDFIYIESKYGKWTAISGLPAGFQTVGEPSNGGVGDDIVGWEAKSPDGKRLNLVSFGNDNLASGSVTLDDVTKLEPFYIYSDDVQYDTTVIVKKVKRIAAEITSSDESLVLRGEVFPRYPFADAVLVDGVVTVAPYTNAKLVSDGTAFTVAVSGDSAYMRDCVLRVECGNTVPTITWPDNFHPRTAAETDFKCEAGKRNVYWITEYAPNELCVAGWQETTGGNA